MSSECQLRKRIIGLNRGNFKRMPRTASLDLARARLAAAVVSNHLLRAPRPDEWLS